jgi:hypothetical protein
MTAEAIARVVHDLRIGNVFDRFNKHYPDTADAETRKRVFQRSTVIDATAMYNEVTTHEVWLYEDHMVNPVWESPLVCYVNQHGNVLVMHAPIIWPADYEEMWEKLKWQPEPEVGHTIDWDRVKLLYMPMLYLGGRSKNEPILTSGPVHGWRVAVYEGGEIADIRWVDFSNGEYEVFDHWQNAISTLLRTFTLANCVNVELAEPVRPKAERKRIERTGVRVSEIHLRPISKSYRGKGGPTQGLVPLHSVRGHFAEYGTNGRGLLFGKYAGRYWIPAHARGNPERGEVEQSYLVETQ